MNVSSLSQGNIWGIQWALQKFLRARNPHIHNHYGPSVYFSKCFLWRYTLFIFSDLWSIGIWCKQLITVALVVSEMVNNVALCRYSTIYKSMCTSIRACAHFCLLFITQNKLFLPKTRFHFWIPIENSTLLTVRHLSFDLILMPKKPWSSENITKLFSPFS